MPNAVPVPMPHSGALIATFYLSSENAQNRLRERLEKTFALTFSEPHQDWRNTTTRTMLACFTPPRTDDTWVVELALNCAANQPCQDAPAAWDEQRTRLERALDGVTMRLFTQQGLRGYRLIYEAQIDAAQDTDVSDPDRLMPLLAPVRMLNMSNPAQLPVLAHAPLQRGHLWLLHVPLPHVTTLASGAATVYLALCPDEQIVHHALLGRDGTLLMPDMIAHKGYQEIRGYRANEKLATYTANVTALRDAISDMLKQTTGDTGEATNTDDGEEAEQRFHMLLTRYETLMTDVLIYAGVRVSLGQQVGNYHLWQRQTQKGNNGQSVLEYHALHLETALRDVENLLAKGQDALAITSTTVQVRHTHLQRLYEARRQDERAATAERQEREREAADKRNQYLTNVLTIVGVGLGTLEVLLAVSDMLAGIGKTIILAICVIVVIAGAWWLWHLHRVERSGK